jgi:hypothetical protein
MKAQNPIGLHIQGMGMTASEMADCIDHCKAANYRTVTVMNNFWLAQRIKDALPDCVVVFRDSNFEPRPGYSMEDFKRYLGGLVQDKRIVLMVNCEWGWSADHCKMWAQMIETAHPTGWKLCVANTPCGAIKCGQSGDPNEWLIFGRVLLETLAKYPGHYLGLHNYSGPFLWVVSNGGWGTPNNPPAKIDWSLPQWHLGREIQGIAAACKVFGIDPKKIVVIITEGLFDQMDDLANNPTYPYRTVKSNRWRYLIPFWAQHYKKPDGSPENPEDVLANQHIWAWETIYAAAPVTVVGIHAFLFRDESHANWLDDRLDNAPRYRKRMEDYQPGIVQEPPKQEPPTSSTGEYVYFRADDLETIRTSYDTIGLILKKYKTVK